MPPPAFYTARFGEYRFRMERSEAAVLRALPDLDAREEPAVAEDFLRTRAEAWADALASASAGEGEYEVRIDPHQRRARLLRAGQLVFAAEI